MIIAKVIGNVWATRKEDTLNGLKLMVVQRVDLADKAAHESFIAVDCVGAGIGEQVLVTTGSSARQALRNEQSPVDAAIVGIIDELTAS
ncbi:EutN/CcmL family microcompartment protein [Desulfobaculum bizertense]|uniref:Ethanolamine utilization protein EutN n=1 Tax=Desulfobaculum bizertense DSM 18034 TaxID=1121442 RepID=A0A1T4W4C4_9BACT|nr:EutN/CcmL family microcompartment protein [Desulfobaculum bizertense]UIJ38670.1 EutN/CcmL family microcompartment protein [Desulfobaculum bizertense]SKA72174.1 ethanolamine utilization protein EutN [Desulfobaculum bizertense DSM 18034]